MVAPITASKKTANGKDTWWLIPACASTSAPTAAEVNAAAGLNITGFVMSDQDGFTPNTSKINLPRLLIETATTEAIDTTVWSMPDVVGIFDPQAAAAHNDKKFWALVKDGYTGFLVRRQNVTNDADVAVTAGQFVDVAPVEFANATPAKSTPNADGIYTFVAAVSLGTPVFNVAVAV